jgi:spore coat polysaccharide biosynthesis protein SpsF
MNTVAVIQARHTSTRLPGKMLLPLAGKPVIEHIIDRARCVAGIDEVCVTIPHGEAQKPLEIFLMSLNNVRLSRGPDDDLLRRFARAAHKTDAEVVVRLWGDCPAIDPTVIDHLLNEFYSNGADWAYLNDKSGYPLGYECQAYKRDALRVANLEVTDPTEREFIHSYFLRHPMRYKYANVTRHCHGPVTPSTLQLLLDTPSDYCKLVEVFDRLYGHSPAFGLTDIEMLAKSMPSLF